MVLRIDAEGRAIKDGRQVQIGGNERYLSVCRKHLLRLPLIVAAGIK
jgi:thymidine kinase